ncbi:hypothetical protein [Nonomuraea sediminis]|uniref:hypothetical protein n=1 Tax=Nonomuraea sediminis TaxID=2835864 RepID=UPI001BDC2DBE|nr:hypothetical protein [Nonomuraea sediminis]
MAQLDASPFPDDLPVAPPRRGPSRLTLALAAAVVLVAGVLIGIQAQKAFGSSALPSGQRSGFSGFSGYGGQSPGGQSFGGRQGFGGATVGTVEKISGEQVYLRTMDGSTVKVTTTGATTVEIARPGKLSDLKTGGTIVVRGQKAADGSVSAVSISQGGGGR